MREVIRMLNKSNQVREMQGKTHYKMYKSKRGWLVTGVSVLSFAAFLATGTGQAQASDDVNVAATSDAETSQVSDTDAEQTDSTAVLKTGDQADATSDSATNQADTTQAAPKESTNDTDSSVTDSTEGQKSEDTNSVPQVNSDQADSEADNSGDTEQQAPASNQEATSVSEAPVKAYRAAAADTTITVSIEDVQNNLQDTFGYLMAGTAISEGGPTLNKTYLLEAEIPLTNYYVVTDPTTLAGTDFLLDKQVLKVFRSLSYDTTTGKVTLGDWETADGSTITGYKFEDIPLPTIPGHFIVPSADIYGDATSGYTLKGWIIDNAHLGTVADVATNDGLPYGTAFFHTDGLNNTAVTYMPTQQNVIIKFVDDSTGKLLASATGHPYTGATVGASFFSTAATIAHFESLGYSLISDDYPANGFTADTDDNVDQVFYVHFGHNYDYGEITVDRTITFTSSDGKADLPETVVQHVVYKTVTNKATGEIAYTPQGVYSDYDVPSISGYTPDKTTIQQSNPSATLTKPTSSTVNVNYVKDETPTTPTPPVEDDLTLTVVAVDKDGNVLGTVVVSRDFHTGDDYSVIPFVYDGYTPTGAVTVDSAKAAGTFGDSDLTVKFVYDKDTVVDGTTEPTEPTEPIEPAGVDDEKPTPKPVSHKTATKNQKLAAIATNSSRKTSSKANINEAEKLPQTSESTNVWSVVGLALAVNLLGFAGFKKKWQYK